MSHFICQTCGVQQGESAAEPEHCPICEDERQFVGWDGQRWTTLEALSRDHTNRFDEMEPGLVRIGTRPSFAIGQHAYLVAGETGNVLWDCISLLDEATVATVNSRGGLRAIALSHPHYYSTMVEWSRAFSGAPVYVHADDRSWVQRGDPAIVFWEGETLELGDGLTLIHGGGHFDGGTMLHWPAGAGGRGALLVGDIVQVVYDRRWVSFMYSYPNLIPLPLRKVDRLVEAVEPFEFDRLYSPWDGRVVERDGKEVVKRSAERYRRALLG